MFITIQSVLDDTGLQYTEKDLHAVSQIARETYFRTFSKHPLKTTHERKGDLTLIDVYPQSYRSVLLDMVIHFLTNQKVINTRQQKIKTKK